MTGRFSKSRFGSNVSGEDVNPMDGLSNLADVMLVLAVGIMLALVLHWNIDVSPITSTPVPPKTGEEFSEIEGLTDGEETPLDSEAEYEDLGSGRIYRDPSTGKYYLVQDDADD